MVKSLFIPRKGDFVSYFFESQAGHEQQGRRSALVISNDAFNLQTGIAFVCPITKADRDYPFHIPIPAAMKLSGVVMVDQIKVIDYRARKCSFLEKSAATLLDEVLMVLDRIVN